MSLKTNPGHTFSDLRKYEIRIVTLENIFLRPSAPVYATLHKSVYSISGCFLTLYECVWLDPAPRKGVGWCGVWCGVIQMSILGTQVYIHLLLFITCWPSCVPLQQLLIKWRYGNDYVCRPTVLVVTMDTCRNSPCVVHRFKHPFQGIIWDMLAYDIICIWQIYTCKMHKCWFVWQPIVSNC